MQEDIKSLRVQIDGLAQLAKALKPIEDVKISYFEKDFNRATLSSNMPIQGWKDMANSKEIEKCVDSLYLAKAWLGKVLGELGTANPYGSGYKTKEDIVPTQDVASVNPDVITNGFDLYFWEKESNHIQKVDWLRTEIQKLVPQLDWTKEYPINDGYSEWRKDEKIILAMRTSQNHLSEARFWLGFELERLRN